MERSGESLTACGLSPKPRLPPPADLDFHSSAALSPRLPIDSREFGVLVADIGAHGLLQPIVLHEGRSLDGRNRCRACQHAGVELGAG
jgi:hypothetical protein